MDKYILYYNELFFIFVIIVISKKYVCLDNVLDMEYLEILGIVSVDVKCYNYLSNENFLNINSISVWFSNYICVCIYVFEIVEGIFEENICLFILIMYYL